MVGLKKGWFSAHRNVQRSEDKTALLFDGEYGREGCQGHPPGDAQTIFGRGEDPYRRLLLRGLQQARRPAPGGSCPSDCANGRTGSDQWDLVLAKNHHRNYYMIDAGNFPSLSSLKIEAGQTFKAGV